MNTTQSFKPTAFKPSVGLAAVAAILLLLATAGYLSMAQLTVQAENRAWVLHTVETLTQLQVISELIKDAETGQRGFALTGKPAYLQPFDNAVKKLPGAVTSLRNLTKDNPVMLQQIVALSEMIDGKIAELTKTISLLHSNKREEALQLINTDVGQNFTDDIRLSIATMTATSKALLIERTQVVDAEVKRTTYTSIALILGSILLMVGMAWLVTQFFAGRQKAEGQRDAVENRLALQYAIAKTLGESQTIEEMTKEILETIGELMNWSMGFVWTVDKAANVLRCTELWCPSKRASTNYLNDCRKMTFALGVGLPGRTWQNAQPCWVEDVDRDDNFDRTPLVLETNLKAAFAFPIMSGKQVIGVCEFFSAQPRPIDPLMQTTMSAAGHQLGQYMVRKGGEEELRLSEKRFRQMAENIKEIFWISDAYEGAPVYVSPAYEQMFGRTVASLLENPNEFFEATHPDDREKLAETIRRQWKVNYSCELEYRIVPPSGEVSWLWSRFAPIVDADGKIVAICSATNDITSRKEAEQRVGDFYSIVSHELRTPLTSIRGSLGLIEGGKAGEIPEKAMKLIKIGRTESDRLIRLINDILDIKKVEAGRMELNKIAIEPRKLVARTFEAIEGMASEAGIVLRSSIVDKKQIFGDFEKLMQVLTNLVSNAIKYSPRGSEVTVTVESRSDASLRFAVGDHGPGIPANQMHKLFEMFQQLDASDSRKKGTGLGLAISKSIVEEHIGTIGAESEQGKGSVFWFDIPIDHRSNTRPKVGGIKVLVIESDQYWADVMNRVFTDGTFDVTYVDSTAAADEEITENRPDMVVLDLQSTNGDGAGFVDRLKSNPATNAIPFVVFSSEERADVKRGEAFLTEWVIKPFEPRQMKIAIAKALRNRKVGPTKVLVVEDDAAIREILCEQISELGAECLKAADGLEAVDIARSESLDLIILDLGLPVINGFEVIKILREDKTKLIPLIVYTNRDLTKEDKKNLTLGFTSHLVKSRTSAEDLIACVKDLLDGRLESDNGNNGNGKTPAALSTS